MLQDHTPTNYCRSEVATNFVAHYRSIISSKRLQWPELHLYTECNSDRAFVNNDHYLGTRSFYIWPSVQILSTQAVFRARTAGIRVEFLISELLSSPKILCKAKTKTDRNGKQQSNSNKQTGSQIKLNKSKRSQTKCSEYKRSQIKLNKSKRSQTKCSGYKRSQRKPKEVAHVGFSLTISCLVCAVGVPKFRQDMV